MKRHAKALLLLLIFFALPLAHGQTAPSFDAVATTALQAMRSKAATLQTEGVALLAYVPGDSVQAWTSKMLVVGHMTHAPSDTSKGDNLLAVAYSKAAEMADTLKDSGGHTRPPMTGEVGWKGGAIVRVSGGYLLAAFSGGKSEDDLAISRAGLAELQQQMKLTAR